MTRKSVVYLVPAGVKSIVDNFNDDKNEAWYTGNNLNRRNYSFPVDAAVEDAGSNLTHYIGHAWCDEDDLRYLSRVAGIQTLSQDRRKGGRTLEAQEHAEDLLTSRSLRLRREAAAQLSSVRRLR